MGLPSYGLFQGKRESEENFFYKSEKVAALPGMSRGAESKKVSLKRFPACDGSRQQMVPEVRQHAEHCLLCHRLHIIRPNASAHISAQTSQSYSYSGCSTYGRPHTSQAAYLTKSKKKQVENPIWADGKNRSRFVAIT